MVWALDRLKARRYAEPRLDLAQAAHGSLEAWREEPGVLTVLELPEPARASLLMGESGILAVLWRLGPSDGIADDLYRCVRENTANAANDLMWGAPGTMLAALTMFRSTSDERWANVWREGGADMASGPAWR